MEPSYCRGKIHLPIGNRYYNFANMWIGCKGGIRPNIQKCDVVLWISDIMDMNILIVASGNKLEEYLSYGYFVVQLPEDCRPRKVTVCKGDTNVEIKQLGMELSRRRKVIVNYCSGKCTIHNNPSQEFTHNINMISVNDGKVPSSNWLKIDGGTKIMMNERPMENISKFFVSDEGVKLDYHYLHTIPIIVNPIKSIRFKETQEHLNRCKSFCTDYKVNPFKNNSIVLPGFDVIALDNYTKVDGDMIDLELDELNISSAGYSISGCKIRKLKFWQGITSGNKIVVSNCEIDTLIILNNLNISIMNCRVKYLIVKIGKLGLVGKPTVSECDIDVAYCTADVRMDRNNIGTYVCPDGYCSTNSNITNYFCNVHMVAANNTEKTKDPKDKCFYVSELTKHVPLNTFVRNLFVDNSVTYEGSLWEFDLSMKDKRDWLYMEFEEPIDIGGIDFHNLDFSKVREMNVQGNLMYSVKLNRGRYSRIRKLDLIDY